MAGPRSGLATAITGIPESWSSAITPAQLDASVKAPWTSTTVGVLPFLKELAVVMASP